MAKLSEETKQKIANSVRNSEYHTSIPLIRIEDYKSKAMRNKRLFKDRGRMCEKCGWAKKNVHGIVPVQIHHKDGDSTNNKPENLEVLCPNCHSLTDNFMYYGRTKKKE